MAPLREFRLAGQLRDATVTATPTG
jgi:hypothetical protein